MKKIVNCRFCKSKNLKDVINLGNQFLTGVFPSSKNIKISKGPLTVCLCENCGLLQLRHSFNLNEMYGKNYGYRSSLNSSMVNHLHNKSYNLIKKYKIRKNDFVIDIGSNDGTFLNAFKGFKNLIGIDPTIKKFKKYYKKNIITINDFFPSKKIISKKAKLITCISMFYDLEDPLEFVKNIKKILDTNGIWHFEQSYMPFMLKQNSYDTICHEHLEYYSLNVVKKILNKAGLKILDVEFNNINGGSFSVSATHKKSKIKSNNKVINWLLNQEKEMKLNDIKIYQMFNKKIKYHKKSLNNLLNKLKKNNKSVSGLGASTKGNVILQYCNINKNLVKNIYEINKDKFEKYTPGTKIKILSDKKITYKNSNYLLVLPWHFKDHIIKREKRLLRKGIKLIFPLPQIEII
ncbi:class I SAM-dependent methyltransferase [Candidatus Pelagibacter sp.]|uniref:class I SAM-dependent methyltransferase n=1 Tax=Candidatus Pelagibacter sp. TaxID=2024849 RepID=UPI003F8363CD